MGIRGGDFDVGNVYEIIGSAFDALAGLMFVVIAIVADACGATESQLAAFGTPTVIHFGAALLLAAVSAAPWPGLASFSVALALYGAIGLIYMIVVVRRTRRPSASLRRHPQCVGYRHVHPRQPLAGASLTGPASRVAR